LQDKALSDYGLMIDGSRPCIELEGAQIESANVICPVVPRTP
jgi:hypothetical protein